MSETPKPLLAGNWKMNGVSASLGELAAIADGAAGFRNSLDVVVCPPATLIAEAARIVANKIEIGAQDCSADVGGAFTGDLSATMLIDSGARWSIVGHSERRLLRNEGNDIVRRKAVQAMAARLGAIVCIGETEEELDAGQTLYILANQLQHSLPENLATSQLVIAYEPVWAIGTGRTPAVGDITKVHKYVRDWLLAKLGADGAKIRILYGGSVKPDNAREIMALPNVNGALVGGASLSANSFLAIGECFE